MELKSTATAKHNTERTNVMRTRVSLVGRKFGRLKVVTDGPTILVGKSTVVKSTTSICICRCGVIKTIRNCHLTSGRVKSCGCFRIESTSKSFRTHGMSRDANYIRWNTMIQRCTNPNVPNYKDYGGRGIKVCARWKKFENFLTDMGKKPKRLSLERVNNNGNYEPTNCIWASMRTQAGNTRRNIVFTARGKTGCLSSICRFFKKNYGTVYWRIENGWKIDDALFLPLLR